MSWDVCVISSLPFTRVGAGVCPLLMQMADLVPPDAGQVSLTAVHYSLMLTAPGRGTRHVPQGHSGAANNQGLWEAGCAVTRE